ncbi:MAG: carboxymuconolactone decarboxylase family protein [Verrucomicrobiota bacterium]
MHLRVSQINGCSSCVDGGARLPKKADESDARLFAVAARRDTPYFDEPERAALALGNPPPGLTTGPIQYRMSFRTKPHVKLTNSRPQTQASKPIKIRYHEED